MTTRILFALLALAAAALGVYWCLDARPIAQTAAPAQASPVSAPSAIPPSPSARRLPSQSVHSAPESWEVFRDHFGNELQAEFTASGRLASVRGSIPASRAAGGNFNPNDPQKAIARAREIIDAASDLLGLQTELPLASPIAKVSEVSAQVFFTESKDGLAFQPGGRVTVDLGPQGELLGLYSDYAPDVRVTGETRLSGDAAKKLAVAAVAKEDSSRAEGGAAIIWVNGTEGRRAFEYQVQGRRVIIDAETGAVLSQRDMRKF